MQYTLTHPALPDLATLEHALSSLDPAMLLDFDARGRTLRLSTCATHAELSAALQAAGVGDAASELMQLPSECCGGCGG